MMDTRGKVSIGLPVYNGENYVAHAIESVLAQTYTNFELVISDNASTDRTQEICEQFAAQDPRVHYYRQETNLGAAWNFNQVLTLSQGEYFKWAAHDDWISHDFLSKCVAILENDPSVVLCYPSVKIVDDLGNSLEDYTIKLDTDARSPLKRYHELLLKWHLCFELFGVIRASALRKTPGMGNYGHGDGILLERLAILGRFYYIPDVLLFARKHASQSMSIYGFYLHGKNDYHKYTLWFDPKKAGQIIFPIWKMFYERFITIYGSTLSIKERLLCFLYIFRWALRMRVPLITDLVVAFRQSLWRMGHFMMRRKSSKLEVNAK